MSLIWLLACREAGEIDKSMNEPRRTVPDAGLCVGGQLLRTVVTTVFLGGKKPETAGCEEKIRSRGSLLFVHHSVGSEEWSADGFARLAGRYSQPRPVRITGFFTSSPKRAALNRWERPSLVL